MRGELPTVTRCADETRRSTVPPLDGHLMMSAARRDDGRTVLARQSFRAPFHLGKSYWDGSVLQVQVVNPTAGILAGDRLRCEVTVGEGASLAVTTPAASRAFMMRRGVAECRQEFRVSSGGWLEYFPEPLCPHRDTDYVQRTAIHVEDGAELFWCDSLAPGRVGRGETWAWRRLQIALTVDQGRAPLLRECLDASGSELAAMAAFHGQPEAWFATALVLSPRLAPDDACWEALRALHRDGVWCGVTRLPRAGWIVRVIAPRGQALRDTLAEVRRLLAEKLPALRSDWRKL